MIIENKTKASIRICYKASLVGEDASDMVPDQPTMIFPAQRRTEISQAMFSALKGGLFDHYLKKKSLVIIKQDKAKETPKSKEK